MNDMKQFRQMLSKITSSPYHDQMQRFAAPLQDHFGINHFWYYRITNTGDYSFLGTHTKWCEYCFDEAAVSYFPSLRHPTIATSGISLMKSWPDASYNAMLQTAWDKFQINFNINLVERLPDGVEAFGFASGFNDPQADERLLNNLPLLTQFTKVFREKHQNLFSVANDNRINLATHFGALFYEQPKTMVIPSDKSIFLHKIGLGWIFSLTPREQEVVELLSSGFSAPYIAGELGLSSRTVENYINTIKSKLSCSSKSELIEKAKQISAVLRVSCL